MSEGHRLLKAIKTFSDVYTKELLNAKKPLNATGSNSPNKAPGEVLSEARLKAKEEAMRVLVQPVNVSHYNLIAQYLRDVEEALKGSGRCYIKISFTTKSKLIAGWSPVYFITEVPLAWDLILDTPYIPGSIIKGLLRDYFLELTNDENLTNCVFGEGGGKGSYGMGVVEFLDAYPVSSRSAELTYDIVNPHYKGVGDEYDVRPNPVKFVAINEGVKFVSFISFDKTRLSGVCGHGAAEALLKSILLSMRMGWGRRTTRGYGVLDLDLNGVEVRCPSQGTR